MLLNQRPPNIPYVELHNHSCFSMLDGASLPETLAQRAAELGMPALALTDHDAVYGAPRFIQAAQDQGIQPILGAEITLGTGAARPQHMTLLVENEAGWHNLCYLISRARHGQEKGTALLAPNELVGCTGGLIALSGCRQGEIAAALLRGDRPRALAAGRRFRDLFGRDHFWIELQRHFLPGEERLVPKLAALADYLQLACVATNNVHYAQRDGHRLQDVLVCIRHRPQKNGQQREEPLTLDNASHLRRLNSETYLKSAGQMAALFADYPQAVSNTQLLADRCHFELQYGLQDLPHFPTPQGMSSSAYLHRLCEETLPRRYPDQGANQIRDHLVHELSVIDRAGLANYFLIVWDIVRFAREQGIRCQGRGSAANSLVAYLLYISPIDPLAHDLVFERFLSEERQAVPDIDIDFDAQRREEVIQYIYERYGSDHTAMACTFVTFRNRSALRDVGKALDMSPEAVASAAEILRVRSLAVDDNGEADQAADGWTGGGRAKGGWDEEEKTEIDHDTYTEQDQSPTGLLLDLAGQIDSFPRHLGIHSGGMIITGPPMMGRVPTEPATMADRVVVQWDKDGLEDAGLVKIDILGLRMLSAISESLEFIEELTGSVPDLDNLPADDPAVYEMIGRADTLGVFQVESRAQAQMLPKLWPRCFNDLVVAISLIRPGPIQGHMVHPFLRRRQGLESIEYAHPLLEASLSETLGVILFQEQVLKVARDLAGFTPGQGELLRRALGSKRAGDAIERFHGEFVAGAEAKGVPADIAEGVFDQLRAFGGYSFAKSHAAAFAVLVYQSAWLKLHHFASFYAALLNNQPMGFWNPAVLVNEARRQGVPVLPVDIHLSQDRCQPFRVEGVNGIRLGLNYIKSLREEHIQRILTSREKASFTSLDDFYARIRPGRRATENLIMSGAMDGWGLPRRQLLWELGRNSGFEEELDLRFTVEEADLPALSPAEAMLGEQEVLGLSTGEHIMAFFRHWLEEGQILDSEALSACAHGRRVRAAGLLVVHQSPPTAKGHHFLTLEDENGLMNIIVRPQVYERNRRILHDSRLLIVEGNVQQEGGVTSLLARRLGALRT